jgi:acetolactate synthase-1/2/3 large subunit
LKIHGVDLAFCVPGESYLAVLDPLYGASDPAVAAKLVCPDRPVVCFAGDGCFLMTAQELQRLFSTGFQSSSSSSTMACTGRSAYIKSKNYPERVIATDLVNPDFVGYAKVFGAEGALVETTEEFAPAFQAALQLNKPVLLELRIDPEALTPRRTLSEIRSQALAGRQQA